MFVPALLKKLQERGFGQFLSASEHVDVRFDVFLKPHPATIDETHKLYKVQGVTPDIYAIQYYNMSHLSQRQKQILQKYHAHRELLEPLLTQTTTTSETPTSVVVSEEASESMSRQTSLESVTTVSSQDPQSSQITLSESMESGASQSQGKRKRGRPAKKASTLSGESVRKRGRPRKDVTSQASGQTGKVGVITENAKRKEKDMCAKRGGKIARKVTRFAKEDLEFEDMLISQPGNECLSPERPKMEVIADVHVENKSQDYVLSPEAPVLTQRDRSVESDKDSQMDVDDDENARVTICKDVKITTTTAFILDEPVAKEKEKTVLCDTTKFDGTQENVSEKKEEFISIRRSQRTAARGAEGRGQLKQMSSMGPTLENILEGSVYKNLPVATPLSTADEEKILQSD